MSTDNLRFLGWGIVGTPKGRQQSNAGANQQLKVSFDLSQDIGVCLPDPRKTTEFLPLYCISRKVVGNHHVLALSEYFSIFEQGQTRAGSYFGAFVQTVNSVFSSEDEKIADLLGAVRSLSSYQTKHFIDVEKKAYIESIDGKSFTAPEEYLSRIADKLKPLPEDILKKQKGDVLYIHCSKNSAIKALQTILNGSLYFRYNYIFFSESEYISQQISMKKVEQTSLEGLIQSSLFTQDYQSLVLHQSKKIQDMTKENRALQHNQEQIIAEKIREKEGQFEAYISSLQGQLEQLQKQNTEQQVLADLAVNVVNEVGNRAEKLGKYKLAQFSTSAGEKQKFSDEFTELRNSIANLVHRIETLREPKQPEHTQKGDSLFLKLLSAFLGLLSMVFLVWAIYATLSSESQEDIKRKIKQAESAQKEQVAKEYESKINSLNEQLLQKNNTLEQVRHKMKEICNKVSKDKEADSLCKAK